jgi:hypothetical protein
VKEEATMADESLARIYADWIQQLAVKAELKHRVDVELAQVIGELLGRGDDALRALVGGMLRAEALAIEAPDPCIPDKPTAADSRRGSSRLRLRRGGDAALWRGR